MASRGLPFVLSKLAPDGDCWHEDGGREDGEASPSFAPPELDRERHDLLRTQSRADRPRRLVGPRGRPRMGEKVPGASFEFGVRRSPLSLLLLVSPGVEGVCASPPLPRLPPPLPALERLPTSRLLARAWPVDRAAVVGVA